MKRILILALIFSYAGVTWAGVSQTLWSGHGGEITAASAKVHAAISGLDGTIRAHPNGTPENPGLTRALERKTQRVIESMDVLTTALDEILPTLDAALQRDFMDAYDTVLSDLGLLQVTAMNRSFGEVGEVLDGGLISYGIALTAWSVKLPATGERL